MSEYDLSQALFTPAPTGEIVFLSTKQLTCPVVSVKILLNLNF